MAGNIHSIGMSVTNLMRGEIAGVSGGISIKRKEEATETIVGPFDASSPPINQVMLTDLVDLHEGERVFFFDKVLTGSLGEPKRGDIIIDHSDSSEWKILPFDSQSYWKPHGQDKTAYKVMTKQNKEGV